jgi:sRNA-binding protein
MTPARQPLAAAQAARADAVIGIFQRLWPQCFSVYQRRCCPLAIGIDRALLAQLASVISSGRISETDVKLALSRYVGADGYLENCIGGRERVGLDGKPVGAAVSERDAVQARGRLAGRRKRKLERLAAQQKTGAAEQHICELKVGTEGGRAEAGLSATGTEIAATLVR